MEKSFVLSYPLNQQSIKADAYFYIKAIQHAFLNQY